MKKGFIIPLLLVFVAILIIGGGFYVYHEDRDLPGSIVATSTATTTNEDNNVTPPSLSSGIKGHVSIGPTCPVVNDNDVSNTCADKPYQTTFEVLNSDKQIVKSFQSDVNGNYSVTLPQGQYEIISANSIQAGGPSIFPKMNSTGLINVKDSTYTTVNIAFDSGIR